MEKLLTIDSEMEWNEIKWNKVKYNRSEGSEWVGKIKWAIRIKQPR